MRSNHLDTGPTWRWRLRLLPRVLLAVAAIVAADLLFVAGFAWFVGSVGPTLSLLGLAAVAALGGELDRAVDFLAAIGEAVDPTALVVPRAWILVGGAALVVAQGAFGYRRALDADGVQRLTADDRPELRTTLTRLAVAADVPSPDLAVVDHDRPNSFTVGRPGAATVVLTTGLLDRLDDRELRAVLAHEVAHLVHRDVTVTTVASAVVPLTDAAIDGVPALLAALQERIDRAGERLRERLAPTDGRFAADRRLAPVAALAAFIAVAVALLTTLHRAPVRALAYAATIVVVYRPVARVPQLPLEAATAVAVGVLSRARELAADRTAAQLTGDPAALASALRTVHDDARPDLRLRSASQALCIAPNEFARGWTPLDAIPAGRSRSSDRKPVLLVASHPPAEERLERLRGMVEDPRS